MGSAQASDQMRVRHLQTHLHDQNLVLQGKLSDIHSLVVGIDAVFWLRSIQALKDPFADALGGVPPGIFGYVDRELERFRRAGINPVFVFQGMAPSPQHPLVSWMEQHTDMAWAYLAKGHKADAQKCFAVCTSRINADFVYFIFHHLKNRGFDCFQAPYFAGSQLSHFASEGLLGAVFGPPGLLLYGVPKVIINFDFQRSSFDWLDLNYILSTWDIELNVFRDACILAGTDYCLTYPFLGQMAERGNRFSFDVALSVLKQLPMINWLDHFPSSDMRQEHLDGYCISKVLLHHNPILHLQDQVVRPLSHGDDSGRVPDVPKDFSVIMGERLPNSLYLLMCKGIISAKLPQALAKGEWTDKTQPLVDTQEYRHLLVDLREYREKALSLVARHLHPKFSQKLIVRKVYFDANAVRHNSRHQSRVEPLRTFTVRTLPWRFGSATIQKELERQNTTIVGFHFCLNWHAHEFQTDGPLIRDLARGSDEPEIDNSQEALCAHAHFMVLEQLGLISEDGDMTFLQNVLKDTPHKFQEPCMVALELMKFGALSGEPFDAASPERPFPRQVGYPASSAAGSHAKAIYLISRVVSLVPMKLRTEMWNANVDFDLAAFHSIVRILKRTLRQVAEACVTSVFLTDLSKVSLLPAGVVNTSTETPETSQFPSFTVSRSCMGIVMRYFLGYKGESRHLVKDLQNHFPCCAQPLVDLQLAFSFWAEFKRCVEIIAGPLETQDLLAEMESATTVLNNQRKRLGITD